MDFGKLTDLEGVDLSLPPDPPETEARLAGFGPASAAPEVRLGMPSWSDRRLRGKLYPGDAAPGEFLRHYGRSFAAVELNTTWYGVNRDWIRSWVEAVPGDFRFFPKFPREICLERRLVEVQRPMEAFLQATRDFGANLGRSWVLLPGDFGPSEFSVLEEFLQTWSRRTPLAVELRHPAWFANGRAREEVFALFEETGTVAVLTDVAGRRDVLHQRITADEVFIRFVGNGLHPTDAKRVDAWAERLAGWMRAGLPRVNVFLHQPEEHLAVELAETLRAGLEERGAPLPRPLARQPSQETLFPADDQG